MARNDFIPGPDADFKTWYQQFRLATHDLAATLGVTAGELTELDADGAAFDAKFSAAATAEAAAKAATSEKKAARTNAESNLRLLLRRMKASRAYDPGMGARLGVLMSSTRTKYDELKPEFSAQAMPSGAVEIAWVKGPADGINIYSQREGDTGWVLLGLDTQSPFTDARPLLRAGQPEARKYRAIYVVADAAVGQYSDDLTCIARD